MTIVKGLAVRLIISLLLMDLHCLYLQFVLICGDSVNSSVCCPLLWCFPISTCQTQTRLQHQKTRARCADRDAWPPLPPTRVTATQPSSTGLTESSRVRQPHRQRRPPRPTREEGPSQTPLHTQLWTPTPRLLLWLTWWRTPSSVSNTQEQPHMPFLVDQMVCMLCFY